MPVTKLMNWKGKLEVLIAEIEKCEVRCGNCPLKNTSQANGIGWGILQGFSKLKKTETMVGPTELESVTSTVSK